MPEIVTCPHCSRKLRVPDDLLGKKVKCPDCKEPFLAQTESVRENSDPADEPPVENTGGRGTGVSTGPRSAGAEGAPLPSLRRTDSDDEDHPARPYDNDEDGDGDDRGDRSSGTRASWQKARLGLNLFISGIYVIIGATVLFLLGLVLALLIGGATSFAALNSTSPTSGAVGGAFAALIVLMISAFLFGLGFLVKIVLQGIGQVFMLWIPDKPGTGRRPLAIAALSLWGGDVLLYASSFGMACLSGGLGTRSGVSGAMGLGSNCLTFISYGCMIAWYFVFMFFMWSIARSLRSDGAARSCLAHMIAVPVFVAIAIFSIVAVVCLGGAVMLNMASSRSASPGSAASMGVGWIIAIVAVYVLVLLIELGLYIWYIVILHQVRGAMTRRLAG